MGDWKIRDQLTKDIVNTLSLARACLKDCPAAVHMIEKGFDGTRSANIEIRADGKNYYAEADWARHALHLLQRIAVENGVETIPDHHDYNRKIQITGWKP